ncbi:MAG TPA: hypothetical protein VN703_10255, partial [Candidatus Sulfopaludibacter sp.]|nr:hypothetical protein [Candidatus Sulfopaludibacter sp.]
KARYVVTILYAGLAILGFMILSTNFGIIIDILALLSIPLIISFSLYDRYISKQKKQQQTPPLLNRYTDSLFTNYISILGIALGIVSIIISLLIHFFSFPSTSIPIRNYTYDIFVLLSSLSPFFIFLLICSLPLKLLINELIINRILRSEKKNNNNSHHINSSFFSDNNNSHHIRSRNKIIWLMLFMLLSVIMVLIPHYPSINKDNRQVGVDTKEYVNMMKPLLKSNNAHQFIQQIFVIQSAGDRPLTLLFLFAIVKTVNATNLSDIIEYLPIILGPSLVLAVFFLTRELTSNDTTSLFASFITSLSFHTLIGVYAGFYANWFGLIIGYSSIAFLFRSLKRSGKLDVIIYFVLLVFLQFSHLYTWTILTIVMAIFLLVMLKFNYYDKKRIFLLLLIILSSVIIDIVRMVTLSSAGGIEQDISIAHKGGVGLGQFSQRWSNLIFTTQNYFIGQFSNFIILVLGLYWLARSNLQEPSNIFIVIFLSMGIVPLFFGNLVIQTRVLYDIPFQIPAAIALTYIMKKYTNGTMMILPICIWLIAISFRAVSNFFGFILPS